MRFPGGLPGLLFFGSLCLGASAQARPAEDELAGALASLIQPEGPYHAYGDWRTIASATGRQAALHRRLRCDTVACPKAQESYLLVLDGELPPREQGEVEAVEGRCPGR